MTRRRPRSWLREWIQLRLSATDALLLMSILGIACGVLAGGIIIGFRWLIEIVQGLYLSDGREDFGVLPAHWRLVLPILGGLLVGVLMAWIPPRDRIVGIAHVLERLSNFQGIMPIRNAVLQFVGAAISIASGHSVGREGPAAHLGAAGGSALGQSLRLPHNSLRVLIGCGVAAAVAASFNTPLAGVIFAMEVVLMEYTLAGFLPIMLAAVTATVISQVVYGTTPALLVPAVHMESFQDLLWLLAMGLVIGGLAAAFIHSLRLFTLYSARIPIIPRTTLAGVAVGILGLAIPEVMGLGYDVLNRVLFGELTFWLLLGLVAAKLLASTLAVGLGVPGGLVGPTVVVGAAAGAAMGHVVHVVTPTMASPLAFYALVGLGAMMGATLRAPLAALTALLELTYTPGIILPGMLTIAAATLCSSAVFRLDSVFAHQLRLRGVILRDGAVAAALSRLGIARMMDRRISVAPRQSDREALRRRLASLPTWIVIRESVVDDPVAVIAADELRAHLADSQDTGPVDLCTAPLTRLKPAVVDLRCSLRDALDVFRETGADMLCVGRTPTRGMKRYFGVVSRQELEARIRLGRISGQGSAPTER